MKSFAASFSEKFRYLRSCFIIHYLKLFKPNHIIRSAIKDIFWYMDVCTVSPAELERQLSLSVSKLVSGFTVNYDIDESLPFSFQRSKFSDPFTLMPAN